jgi:hypothetical protein
MPSSRRALQCATLSQVMTRLCSLVTRVGVRFVAKSDDRTKPAGGSARSGRLAADSAS